MTGRIKGLNNWHTLKAVALTAAAFVVLSCQQEQIQDNLDGRITLYPIIENRIETTVMTRAAIDQSKYARYDNQDNRQVISVQAISFLAGSNTRTDKDAGGTFAPVQPTQQNPRGWRSGVKVEPNVKYDLYAYSRLMPSATDPTFTYQNGSASLAFNGLHVITTKDPLVCVAASGKVLPDNPTEDTYPVLYEGVFNIGDIVKVTDNGVEKTTKAFLAMDHLYSKATLSFRVDATYKSIRNIRIKDVDIVSAAGTLSGTHTYKFTDNSLTLAEQGSLGGDPITIDIFGSDADLTTFQLDEDSTYYTLTTDYQEIGYFYFLPKNELQPIQLKVTYDVVDMKGNVTRTNVVTPNDNLFQSIKTSARRGVDYKVLITVSPTYIYTLSDDDVEMKLNIVEQQ